jgi:hypothetical protein
MSGAISTAEIFGFFLMILGLSISAVSAFRLLRVKRIIKKGKSLNAVVLENNSIKEKTQKVRYLASKTLYGAVLKYEVDKTEYIKENKNLSTQPIYEIGQELEIYYDIEAPANFVIACESKAILQKHLYAMAIGLLCILIGVIHNLLN